ncbi:MAG TPA: T9SS type A sorting domain-containing protein [Mucilaginibacter sp.]|nr:T9SS type A sorting domain-containing protein [Mucilaginibacter sp.]
MKRLFLYLGFFNLLLSAPGFTFGAVPNIRYTPSTNTLTLGTAFSITPSNTGGSVTTGSYAPIYSFATVSSPWDVTVDASGNVYTVSESGNTLIEISPTGTKTTLYSGLSTPTGVAIDSRGNIYVSNFGSGQVLKFDSSGNLLASINGFNQPYGISFDSSNNAYVADAGDNTVYEITAGTTTVSTYASGLTSPYGTAVDASGNLYVSQYTANNLVKITPAGVKTTFAAGFNAPRQLGMDASGNIYVADYGNNAIKKVTSAGVVSTITQASGLNAPRSVQPDASGSLYIADYGSGAIKKVAVTGWTISATLPDGLTFNTSTGKISGTPTVTFTTTTYTVIAYNTSGKASTTITLSCSQSTMDWKGTTSSAWATTTNWSPNGTPNQYTAVRIGSNVTFTNQPTLSASTTVSSITFGTTKTATLTIASGATLTINDNLTVNSTGTPTITGSGTAAVAMAPGSIINITNASAKLTLTSPLSFTLQSDATGDASIGQLASTTAITGSAASSINVERYLSGGSLSYRGYRLLSSPVYVGQDTHSNNVEGLNYLISSMYLTATTTTGGFDNTVAANPSLYLFRENLVSPTSTFTGGNYRSVNAINNTPNYNYTLDGDGTGNYVPVGNGYLCFVRGNRASTSFAGETSVSYVPQAVTLSASGTLNMGQVTVKDWFTPTSSNLSYTAASPYAGFNLVGNPYASSIDWDNFQTSSSTTGIYGSNVSSTIYELDPITKNYGSYMSGSGGIGSATFVSNIIASGQGFFVLATSGSGQLVFNESAKTTSQNTQGSTLLMSKQPVAAANMQYLRLQIGEGSVRDQTLIRFNSQASTDFSYAIDAPYKTGYGAVSLATRSSDNVDLSINTVPLPKLKSESIRLNVNASKDGIYNLAIIDIVSVPQLFDIWLMDAYTKDSVDMRHNKSYSFNIYKSDSASFGPKRFTLVIRQNPAYAYRLLSFTGQKVQNEQQTELLWKTENEGNYTYFTVQRSIDNGKTYDDLGSANAAGSGQYSLMDKNPFATGPNYYRLKQIDFNGGITYSNIVVVGFANQANGIYTDNLSIYPNPVNSMINLSIKQQSPDNTTNYDIKITNSSGLVVKEVISSQPSWQGSINNLGPGTYIVTVVDNKTKGAIGQTKFIKL